MESWVNQAWVRKAFRDLDAHCAKFPSSYVPIVSPPVLKKIDKLLKRALDPGMTTRWVLPEAPWAESVFTPSCVGFKAPSMHASWQLLGKMEALTVFQGTAKIFSIESTSMLGASYADKRKWLYTATIDELISAAKGHGYLAVAEAGITYVFPSGFCWVMVANEGMKGMRWSLTSDEGDKARVMLTVRGCLNAFTELRQPSTGWQSFLDFLEAE